MPTMNVRLLPAMLLSSALASPAVRAAENKTEPSLITPTGKFNVHTTQHDIC